MKDFNKAELEKIESIKNLTEKVYDNRVLILRADYLINNGTTFLTHELYSSDLKRDIFQPITTIGNVDEPLIDVLQRHLTQLEAANIKRLTVGEVGKQRW